MRHKHAAGDVLVKTAQLLIKEAGPDDGLAEGEFIAYASVFGNKDTYGDIVEEDAFDRTLAEWAEKGDVIPLLWGHDMFDPFSNIGGVKEAVVIKSGEKADGEKPGLKVHAFMDLENPKAAQVYKLVKGRRTTKMSFAYGVQDESQDDAGNHLKDLDLYEVSVVQVPANQEAEILAVKHATDALVKAGRVLSAKNETALREARDAIDAVLSSLASQDGEDGKAGAVPAGQKEASGDQPPAKGPSSTEEPPGAKAGGQLEEPEAGPSVDDLDLLFTIEAAIAAEGA